MSESYAAYKYILARIEKLMDAEPGTKEGEELNRLVEIVRMMEGSDGGPSRG